MTDKRRTPWQKTVANDWPCTPDCPKRYPGCHSSCKEYAKAKEENDAKKAEIRARRIAQQTVDAYVARRASEASGKPLKQR